MIKGLCALLGAAAAMAPSSVSFREGASVATGYNWPLDVSVALGDLDNDKDMDMLVSAPEGVRLFENVSGNYMPKGLVYRLGNNDASVHTGVAIGDLDNDGKKDFVLATPEGVRVFMNKGAAGKDESKEFNFDNLGLKYKAQGTSYITGVDVKLEDVNGDKKPDIIFATSSEVKILLGE